MVRQSIRFIIISFFFAISGFFNLAIASDAHPAFNCTLTDSESGDAKDKYTKDTQMLYLLCSSSNVTKGQNLKATWIATDTNNIAPANYKIDEKGVVVDKDLGKNEEYSAKFTLSRPDKGWPVGQYRVELYVDKDLINTFKFNIN